MMTRRATPADLDAIMALETSVFTTDAWSSDAMRSELSNTHGHYLVVEDAAGVVVAYAGLLAPRGSGQADIQTIAVVESERRSGIGRALMTSLVDEARAREAEHLFLEVRADNPAAQTLYRDLGFEQIALRPGYYQPGNVDALVMRMTL
jgi:ribosomal-protein-alanine acetyltransferase